MNYPRPSRTLTEKPDAAEPAPAPKYKASDLRPSDVFRFEPLPDITVTELAYLLMVLYEPAIHFKNYLNLPENIQRHFRLNK